MFTEKMDDACVAAGSSQIVPRIKDDAALISMCGDVQQSVANEAKQPRPTKASIREGSRICGVMRRITKTKAVTMAGLKAKAAAYIAVPSDELADALALDMLRYV